MMQINELSTGKKGLQNLYSAVRFRPAPPILYLENKALRSSRPRPATDSIIPQNTAFRGSVPDQNRIDRALHRQGSAGPSPASRHRVTHSFIVDGNVRFVGDLLESGDNGRCL